MSEDEIRQMPAGREMDVLIDDLMGVPPQWNIGSFGKDGKLYGECMLKSDSFDDAMIHLRKFGQREDDRPIRAPSRPWSTSIEDAMDVLCKVRKGEPFMITAGLMDGSDQYEGRCYCSILQAEAFGDTISHAICIAALLARKIPATP